MCRGASPQRTSPPERDVQDGVRVAREAVGAASHRSDSKDRQRLKPDAVNLLAGERLLRERACQVAEDLLVVEVEGVGRGLVCAEELIK